MSSNFLPTETDRNKGFMKPSVSFSFLTFGADLCGRDAGQKLYSSAET
jgi:hypothetical protein